MVERDCVGIVGQPFELVVERGKIREFARATHAEHPAFQTGACIPPTFLTTAYHWHTAESDVEPVARLDPQRSLHAEQEFVFHGSPPAAGTTLTGTARIDRVYEKRGRRGTLTFVEIVTEYRDETGELVAESRLTGVEMPEAGDG
jgi:hydroxyacyl-ACP dehydratase HTD2-like protein with hotdog domain